MRQWTLVPALLLAAAGFHATGAQASGDRMAGDAASGERLAQSWCSACHAVGVSGADAAGRARSCTDG
ncbi:MAG: hypothetical protein ACK4QW_03780 [Alphaproteobacteria bacterium]